MKNNNIFKILFLLSTLDILSFVAFLYPAVGKIFFVILSISFLFLILKKFELGFLVLLVDLVIGSKGYLFFYQINDFKLSIRIAFFVIFMLVWAGYLLVDFFKNKINPYKFYINNLERYWFVFFAFILLGVANGFLNNQLSYVYQDFNGWLYFLLIFPITWFIAKKNTDFSKQIFEIILASLLFVSLKSLFVLYYFSHDFLNSIPLVYKWIRDTGVGEITRMESGFVRVFFQSHIYLLFGIFGCLINLQEKIIKKWLLFFILTIFFAVFILSFSRTNWLGLAFGLLFYFSSFFLKKNFKKLTTSVFVVFSAFIFSVLLILALIKFPFPKQNSDFSPISIAERATDSGAAVSSRWKLLDPLNEGIIKNFVLGKGFGATIEYSSDDPRVLANNPEGRYKAFAFEWGWHDILYKLGIFGFLSYVYLLGRVAILNYLQSFSSKKSLILTLVIFSLFVMHIFSPYFNHPLGIGVILLAYVNIKKPKII